MVVIFFVSEYDRFNGGQRSLLQLTKNLPAVGLRPIVVFLGDGRCYRAFSEADVESIILPASESLRQFGQELMHLSIFKLVKIFLFDILPLNFRLYRLMTRHRAAILHCNTTRSLLIGAFVPRVLGKKIIWHVRGELNVIRKPMRMLSERLSNRIILVARSLESQISDRYRHKCEVIHNAVDETSFNTNYPDDDHYSIENGQVMIATMAAVTPFKGYHHLLDAIDIINRKKPDNNFYFAAVGQLFDEKYLKFLKRKIHERNIHNFHFLGWQDNPLPYYRRATIVVLPTVDHEVLREEDFVMEVKTGEGLPRTVLEAMFLGKPVVATRVAGTNEQVLDGVTGHLVPSGDSQAMADKILHLLSMSKEEYDEMGKKAKERIEEVFGTEIMIRKMEKLLKDLV